MTEIPYNDPIEKGGLTYSVDMVRYDINFRAESKDRDRYPTAQDFVNYLSAKESEDFALKRYMDPKGIGYKHLFVLSRPDWKSTVSVGLGLGTDPQTAFKGFLEYNPNKVTGDALKRLIDAVRASCDVFTLNRWDLAVDIPMSRHLVRLSADKRRSYEYLTSNGIVTEYVGTRNSIGRVKVYDKQAESGLEMPVTRCEWTVGPTIPTSKDLQPVLVSKGQMELISDYGVICDKGLCLTHLVLLETLRQLDTAERTRYLKRLDRRTREKLVPHLMENELVLDNAVLYELYMRVCSPQIRRVKVAL